MGSKIRDIKKMELCRMPDGGLCPIVPASGFRLPNGSCWSDIEFAVAQIAREEKEKATQILISRLDRSGALRAVTSVEALSVVFAKTVQAHKFDIEDFFATLADIDAASKEMITVFTGPKDPDHE